MTEEKIKVDIVGARCTWMKEYSSSYILNDDTLIDVPNGSFKSLLNDYDLDKIKNIIITHFHSDHFLDLFLVLITLNDKRDHKINIIAPKSCEERLKLILSIIEEEYMFDYIDKFVNFIDVEDGKTIKLDDYEIDCYKVLHNIRDPYGYVVKYKGASVGFSGDTAFCNNLIKIIENTDTIFIDSANVVANEKHLCVSQVDELSKKYPNKTFYPIHLSSKSLKIIPKHFKVLEQGDVVYIK